MYGGKAHDSAKKCSHIIIVDTATSLFVPSL